MFTKFRFPGVCVCVCVCVVIFLSFFFFGNKKQIFCKFIYLFIFSLMCFFLILLHGLFFCLYFLLFFYLGDFAYPWTKPFETKCDVTTTHRSTNLLLMKSKRKIPSVPWWAPSFLRLLLATTAAALLSPPLKNLWSLRLAWPLTRYSEKITRTNGSRTHNTHDSTFFSFRLF